MKYLHILWINWREFVHKKVYTIVIMSVLLACSFVCYIFILDLYEGGVNRLATERVSGFIMFLGGCCVFGFTVGHLIVMFHIWNRYKYKKYYIYKMIGCTSVQLFGIVAMQGMFVGVMGHVLGLFILYLGRNIELLRAMYYYLSIMRLLKISVAYYCSIIIVVFIEAIKVVNLSDIFREGRGRE